MLILQKVLEPEDLSRVRRDLSLAPWRSGAQTAGAAARAVKDNQQAVGDDARVKALEAFVVAALERHPLWEMAARPRRLSRLLFSKYAMGGAYGPHTDDAMMGAGEAQVRTDLAFTLFLSDPGAYEGGALSIESALGAQDVKLEAGDAILYAAGSIHHVAPVTSGERFAAVGWVQSLVADAAQREALFDLSVARARFAAAGAAREDLLPLDKSIGALLRMWARP